MSDVRCGGATGPTTVDRIPNTARTPCGSNDESSDARFTVLVVVLVSRVMNKDLIKATRPAIVHRAQQYRREAGHITERIVTYPLEKAV